VIVLHTTTLTLPGQHARWFLVLSPVLLYSMTPVATPVCSIMDVTDTEVLLVGFCSTQLRN
jgi:hypothetical protein